jgi:hypothetical protein
MWENHFSRLLHVHGVNYIRVECSLPGHNFDYNSDEVEIAIELFKRRKLTCVNQIPT